MSTPITDAIAIIFPFGTSPLVFLSPKSRLKIRKTATNGRTNRMIFWKTTGSSASTTSEAILAPTRAPMADGTATVQLTAPFRMYRPAASVVPRQEDVLLQPKATFGSSPESRYAGMLMTPPPPAIESMKPARKTAQHRKISFEYGIRPRNMLCYFFSTE